MDEQSRARKLDEAIDRLARGLPPGGASADDAQLLELARAVRGLGEPQWPSEPGRFLANLLPRPRRRLDARFVWPAAAAAVLLALLPARLPAPATLTLAAPTAAPVQIPFALQAPAATSFAAQASAPKTTHGSATATMDTNGTVARIYGNGTTRVGAGAWLQPGLAAVFWPGLDRSSVGARDLAGRSFRLPVREAGAFRILDFAGLRPGWYRIAMPGGPVVLLPPPPGGAATWYRALAGRRAVTALPRVDILSVACGPQGVVAKFRLPGVDVAQSIELLGPAGPERPVMVNVGPAVGGVQATLTFDPAPAGTTRLRFLVREASGSVHTLAQVRARP